MSPSMIRLTVSSDRPSNSPHQPATICPHKSASAGSGPAIPFRRRKSYKMIGQEYYLVFSVGTAHFLVLVTPPKLYTTCTLHVHYRPPTTCMLIVAHLSFVTPHFLAACPYFYVPTFYSLFTTSQPADVKRL